MMTRLLCCCLTTSSLLTLGHAATSNWAKLVNGTLQYQNTSNGDHIMDFSWAGYKGGGVALPLATQVPVMQTISPSGGDDTTAIQDALDAVATLAPDANGFRGAVLLTSGTFHLGSSVVINASGIVLRGSGSSGSNATILDNTNGIDHVVYLGASSGGYVQGTQISITDSYVPSGTRSFHVSNAGAFSVGDHVLVNRTVTSAWVHYLGMDQLNPGQTWLAPGTVITTDRIISAISGSTITLDAPLTDSFDSTYLGTPVGTICTYTFAERISQSGVEHLRIECNSDGVHVTAGAFQADKCVDCWVSDVYCHNGMGTFTFDSKTKRCTIDHVILEHSVDYDRSSYAPPSQFNATGTQLLFKDCQVLRSNTSTNTVWTFTTGSTGTGPIAIVNLYSTEVSGVAPHQRWTTGILTDQGSMPNAPSQTEGIQYINRGTAGSGHGWTTGWSVAWNVDTPYLGVQQAPGTLNWSIGSGGTAVSLTNMGTFDSTGTRVSPASLFVEQLQERLGTQAVFNIGATGSRAGRIFTEAEGLSRTSSGATTSLQTDTNTSSGTWVSLNANSTGDYVDFTFPNVPAGTYDLNMGYKGLASRGILSLSVDGTTVGSTLDQYASSATYTSRTFGTVTFTSSGSHTIRLTVTGRNTSSTAYTLSADTFTLTPHATKFSLSASAVSASSYVGSYVPANAVDGDLNTRWTSSGDGQWIQFDLGSGKTVSSVNLAFYAGTQRTYTFDVLVSTDGTNWNTVISNRTSALTSALQTFDFTDTFARYVRVVGHVSNYDNYNNITEAEVWGY
jgi:hypothetical protein